MKKFLCFLILFLLILTGSQLTWAENKKPTSGRLGIIASRNQQNKKLIIAGFIGRTKAVETGIPIGGEIISINGINTKNLDMANIRALMQGESGKEITLLVNNNSKKETYTLKIESKDELATYEKDFYKYWDQVINNVLYEEPIIIDKDTANKLGKSSYGFVVASNYWAVRRPQFAAGYKLCKEEETGENQEQCLNELVKMAQEQTQYDISQDDYKPQIQEQQPYPKAKSR